MTVMHVGMGWYSLAAERLRLRYVMGDVFGWVVLAPGGLVDGEEIGEGYAQKHLGSRMYCTLRVWGVFWYVGLCRGTKRWEIFIAA